MTGRVAISNVRTERSSSHIQFDLNTLNVSCILVPPMAGYYFLENRQLQVILSKFRIDSNSILFHFGLSIEGSYHDV